MDKVAMAEKLHSILRRHATNQQTTSMIAEIVPIIEEVVTAEREANKSAYQALREMFNDGEELECDDGWRVGVDIDLWSLGIEALDGLEAPAPKAEVSK